MDLGVGTADESACNLLSGSFKKALQPQLWPVLFGTFLPCFLPSFLPSFLRPVVGSWRLIAISPILLPLLFTAIPVALPAAFAHGRTTSIRPSLRFVGC